MTNDFSLVAELSNRYNQLLEHVWEFERVVKIKGMRLSDIGLYAEMKREMIEVDFKRTSIVLTSDRKLFDEVYTERKRKK